MQRFIIGGYRYETISLKCVAKFVTASRTRRLITNNIQPLEQIRTELVYKLTELELQIQPFQKQMNQSLSHLKTIQYYIDNQGSVIAGKVIFFYVT